MKAIVSEDGMTIKLPVPFGTAVFILDYNQHDGYIPITVEYSYFCLGREVYRTRKEAEQAVFTNVFK
jgi:hypothetical protein